MTEPGMVKQITHNFISELNKFINSQDLPPHEVIIDVINELQPLVSLLSSKWVPQILYFMYLNDRGFNELKKLLNISPRILSKKLTELVQAGLVEKKIVMEGERAKVKYSLTPNGRRVALALIPLFVTLYELRYEFNEK